MGSINSKALLAESDIAAVGNSLDSLSLSDITSLLLPSPIQRTEDFVSKAADKIDNPNGNKYLENLLNIKSRLSVSNSIDVFKLTMLEAWESLSDQQAKDHFDFQFPSYYQCKEVSMVLQFILSQILMQRLYFIGASKLGVESGGSFIISGPVGVGKTTLVLFLHILLMLFLDNVISIYYEYGEEKMLPPSAIVRYAMNRDKVPTINCADFNGMIKELNNKGKMIVFFGDEIQKLYVNPPISINRCIVNELAILGKSYGHIGVCIGSTLNTINWAHRPNEYGFSGYETLNHSVYRNIPINPIRGKEEFSEFHKILNPSADDEDTKWLFLLSGGVGRYLKTFIIQDTKSLIECCTNLYTTERLFQANDTFLLAILHDMYLNVREELKSGTFDPWVHPHSVSFERIRELEKVHCRGITTTQYIDLSVLVVSNSCYELVLPGILVSYHKFLGTNEGDRYVVMAFEGVLTGWSPNSEDTVPSAGHKNEALIMRMVRKNIQDCDKPATCTSFPGNSGNKSVSDYCDRWYMLNPSFPGIEGFFITRSTDDIYHLTVIQIKTGRMSMIVTQNDAVDIMRRAIAGANECKSYFLDKTKIRLRQVIWVVTKMLQPDARSYIDSYSTDDVAVNVYDLKYVLDHIDVDSDCKKRLENWYSHIEIKS